MTQHTVTSFDTDLQTLDGLVLRMGRAVLMQHEQAAKLIEAPSQDAALHIVEDDRRIDEMRNAIEEKAIQTIAQRQPMAIDLRTVIATLKIATDLERIGDLVKNNAKRLLSADRRTQHPAAVSLARLSDKVAEQIESTLEAYETRNDELAQAVWHRDVEVDALQSSILRELLTYMMEDPRSIGACTHLLFCARNLERMGDHATNIAEQVHYVVTGRAMPIDRPKGDQYGEGGTPA